MALSFRTTPVATAALALASSLVLGALQSVTWHGADAPLVAHAITGLLSPDLLHVPASSALATPTESYFAYGRLTVGVYALLAIHLLSTARARSGGGARLLCALGVAALTGDVLAYWVSEAHGPGIRRIGFWYTELPALVATTLLLTADGVRGLRSRSDVAVFALSLPIVAATTWLLGYLPHGILLGLSLTALVASFVRRAPARVDRPHEGGISRAMQLGLLALALPAALLLAALYRPILRVGPEIEPTPAPAAEPLEGARLHVFNTGFNRMSWWLVGRERPWRPVPAWVIEYPESGLIVFDTGLSDAAARLGEAGMHAPERWVLETKSNEAWTLPMQMRAAALDPDAVHHVVLSHLHGDHTGQLAAFPNARIVSGPGGTASIDDASLRPRWQERNFEAPMPYGPFDASIDVAGDGDLVLLRGGGHTNDGVMLLLELDHGPVLLAGDEVVHGDWLRSDDVQRVPTDPDRAARVRNEVRAFLAATPGASIGFGHDLREIDCERPDIVCHDDVALWPEGLADPPL